MIIYSSNQGECFCFGFVGNWQRRKRKSRFYAHCSNCRMHHYALLCNAQLRSHYWRPDINWCYFKYQLCMPVIQVLKVKRAIAVFIIIVCFVLKFCRNVGGLDFISSGWLVLYVHKKYINTNQTECNEFVFSTFRIASWWCKLLVHKN
jgi:hypothetical protein